jgi:hypothetical protein
MTFHVGQKVVCVDDSLPANPWHRQHPLVKAQVYVVRELHLYPDCNCVDIDGSGRMWQHWRFRPLIEKKTDISIFTEMLTPKTRVREDIGT